jgi:hypothetical protein
VENDKNIYLFGDKLSFGSLVALPMPPTRRRGVGRDSVCLCFAKKEQDFELFLSGALELQLNWNKFLR